MRRGFWFGLAALFLLASIVSYPRRTRAAISPPPVKPVETFNNAPDYSEHWVIATQTGSPTVTYTPGNFRIQAPNLCTTPSGVGVTSRSKQSFAGDVDVSFPFNHGGYG